jgi:hypothetical protein
MRLVIWSVALFVTAFCLHTRHNDFPWYYHPDEPGKVEQVLGWRNVEREDGVIEQKPRPWNFHHPMLLLSTTKLAVNAAAASEPQDVAQIGRGVSAVFTAIAIVALSLLAFRVRGWPAAVATGGSLVLHHQLYELAHYLKEDPALLMGIAVTLLAAHIYERKPTLGAALGLGAACGLAISGKYLGVIALAFALPVLIRNRKQSAFTAATVGLVLVIVAVNFPLLADWHTFSSSFAKETKAIVEGQGQMTQSIPHSRYWSIFLTNTTPVTWVLLLVALVGHARRWRSLSAVEWMILIFPFAYALALSFSPKDNDRYFLPATALFTVLAAIGAVDMGRFARRPGRRLALEAVACAALVLSQLPSWTDDRGGLLRYDAAFQRDDTAEVTRWLRDNVPPPAVIAKDKKVVLPEKRRHGKGLGAEPLPNEILSDEYVADFGTIEELGARGVTHVVITPNTYKKFERAGLRPKEKDAADFERRKAFYTSLRREYEPIRMWPRGTVIYLHPGLEVYRISP